MVLITFLSFTVVRICKNIGKHNLSKQIKLCSVTDIVIKLNGSDFRSGISSSFIPISDLGHSELGKDNQLGRENQRG